MLDRGVSIHLDLYISLFHEYKIIKTQLRVVSFTKKGFPWCWLVYMRVQRQQGYAFPQALFLAGPHGQTPAFNNMVPVPCML